MGAELFTYYQQGTNLAAAVKTAHDEDAQTHGHSAYTGTMSQKLDAVRYPGPALPMDEALRLAEHLEHSVKWSGVVQDKWGDPVAIPVKLLTREVIVTDVEGVLGSADRVLHSVVKQATKQGTIRPGERPEQAALRVFSTPAQGNREEQRFTNGTALLIVRKEATAYAEQSEPDGWLFVGTAAT